MLFPISSIRTGLFRGAHTNTHTHIINDSCTSCYSVEFAPVLCQFIGIRILYCVFRFYQPWLPAAHHPSPIPIVPSRRATVATLCSAFHSEKFTSARMDLYQLLHRGVVPLAHTGRNDQFYDLRRAGFIFRTMSVFFGVETEL